MLEIPPNISSFDYLDMLKVVNRTRSHEDACAVEQQGETHVFHYLDGSKEVKNPDGTGRVNWPNGLLTIINKDQSEYTKFVTRKMFVFRTATGDFHATFPDGSMLLRSQSGTLDVWYQDGTRLHTDQKKVTTIWQKNGDISRILSDGTQTTWGADGSVTRGDGSGFCEQITAGGKHNYRVPSIHHLLNRSYVWSKFEEQDNGDYAMISMSNESDLCLDVVTYLFHTKPGGRDIYSSQDGNTQWQRIPQGMVARLKEEAGAVTVVWKMDGSIKLEQDESHAEISPAGVITITKIDPSISAIVLHPDGTMETTYTNAVREIFLPDGNVITTNDSDGSGSEKRPLLLSIGDQLLIPVANDGQLIVYFPDGAVATLLAQFDGSVMAVRADGNHTIVEVSDDWTEQHLMDRIDMLSRFKAYHHMRFNAWQLFVP